MIINAEKRFKMFALTISKNENSQIYDFVF